jgi:signal transduction histidine kinase
VKARATRIALYSLLLIGVYVATAKLSLMLNAVSGFAAPVWPPTGIALVALLKLGPRFWPAVFIGAFAVNLSEGAPVPVALCMGIGNALEAWIGAVLLRRVGFRTSLEGPRDVLWLTGIAALGSTLPSATIGVTALWVNASLSGSPIDFAFTWSTWWLGDIMGNLVVAPLLLVWMEKLPSLGKPARVAEAVLWAGSTAVAALLIFDGRFAAVTTAYVLHQTYLIFPFLIWGALRFGVRGAATGTCLVSAFAILGAVHGFGPFQRPTLSASLIVLQTFMGVVALTFLVLAAAYGEARRAIQARDDLVAVVSHDLRNPLQVIAANAYLLRGLEDKTDGVSQARERGASIDAAVTRGARLLDDLLDIAKIEAGHLSLERKRVDVGAVVSEATHLLQPLTELRSVRLDVARIDPELVVAADRDRLLQVLSNLIGNAIKYSGAGGSVAVQAAKTGAEVEFAVRDSGPGISEEHRRHVFDRYWQAQRGDRLGAGLGLAIAKAIVEAHGGRIWVDAAAKSGGSVFRFTLPSGEQ